MSAVSEVRIDVVRGAQERHMVSRAASPQARNGEEWLCKCGEHFMGKGAIALGRRHEAAQILVALDEMGGAS